MGKKKNIKDCRFDHVIAKEFVGEYRFPNGERTEKWLCKCDCGKEFVALRKNLIGKMTKTCGCSRCEARKTHGGRHTRLYGVWCGMKERCHNSNSQSYKDYGGRGIDICDAWLNDFSVFKEWAEKNGYTEGLTIDRVDVNRGYEPDNCRWVGMTTQANNRRNTIYISHNGETHTCAEWSRITGIPYDRLNDRVKKGLSESEIFSETNLKTGPKQKS